MTTSKAAKTTLFITILSSWLLALTLAYTYYQLHSTKSQLNHHQNALQIENAAFAKSMEFGETMRRSVMNQFQKAIDKNSEGQPFLDKAIFLLEEIEHYDKLLKEAQKEVEDHQIPYGETLTILQYETRKLKETIEKYEEEHLVRYYKKDTLSLQIPTKEQINELKIAKDKNLWFNSLNEMRLANYTVGTKICQREKSKVSDDGWLHDFYDIYIIPNAKKIEIGDVFEAEIGLYGFGEHIQRVSDLKINDKKYATSEYGGNVYNKKATELGNQKINISVSYKDGFGKKQTIEKTFEYKVVPKCN